MLKNTCHACITGSGSGGFPQAALCCRQPDRSSRILYPWLDRTGRFSALKAAAFALLFVPGLWAAWKLLGGAYDAEPFKATLRLLGDWTVRFLLLALAVTPLRQIGRWPRLLLVRRMLGVTAFVYVAIHFTLYIADQSFDLVRVAREIWLRIYLTIGFVALTGFAVLAATSTDRMVRRLGGRRWQALHRLAYPLTALALIHFLLQSSKSGVDEAVLMSGLYIWLMLHRVMQAWFAQPNWAHRLALALAAALATAFGEMLWYALATGIDPWRVVAANLDPLLQMRPAWWVLVVGLGATAIGAIRARPLLRPAAAD